MSELSHFHAQFVLSREPLARPEGWNTESCSGWTLATHPALPACPLKTNDGSHVGWVVGYAVDASGRLLDGDQALPFETATRLEKSSLEEFIYELGGRFLVIVISENFSALYLDCAGTLAAVYSATEGLVASTTSLLRVFSKEKARSWDLPSYFPRPNQYFPGGLTGDPGIRRLLPNFYLDLERWSPARHWSNASATRVSEDETGPLIDVIVDRTAKNILALTNRYHTYMGLSAGRDSRMILACGRPALDRITFFTYTYNWLNADMYMSTRLSRRFGLRRKIVPTKTPTPALREEYAVRTGHSGNSGKARDIYHASSRFLDLSSAFMIGYGGEVGRGFFWYHVDGPSLPDVDTLLSWMALPDVEIFREALKDWLSELPEMDVYAMLDQLYLEHRVGGWASPHMYGIASFAATLAPLCHRHSLDAMMRLPVDYRNKQRMPLNVIRAAWPELLLLPFQTMPAWLELAQRAASRILPGPPNPARTRRS